MSRPFDATFKQMLEAAPADWAALLGAARPADRVSVIDADVATVTAAADKVIRVADPDPWLLHVEFQADWDDALPARVLLYQAALHLRHRCPVASAVLLLRPAAAAAAVTGRLRMAPPVGPAWEFGYAVLRVWELPPAGLLAGPLAVAPLAALAAPPADVPAVLTDLGRRIRAEAGPSARAEMAQITTFLLLMRFDKMAVEELMGRNPDYEGFLELVESRGTQRTLLALGRKRFGEPTPAVVAAVQAITDQDRLDALTERLLDVSTWDDLFAGG